MKGFEGKMVIFISNFFNHHQRPFSDEMYKAIGAGYVFLETEIIPDERKNMGWDTNISSPYVVRYKKNKHQVLIDSADVVIFGSAPYELIEKRMKSGKLTYVYSERLYKEKCEIYKLPIRFLKQQKKFGRYRNVYLLCSSGYTAADYAKTCVFINKAYKWGYFPETKRYEDVDALIATKDPQKILWCGRFLDWKHPDDMVTVAKRLREEGYDFQIDLIGTGAMEGQLCRLIARNNLVDRVHLLGSMSPEEVRSHMEKASIYLFTSDRNEGWGAVLNESMNSACAVVASHAIGSVPYLIENEKNGLIYRDGDLDDLYQKVKYLLDHPDRRAELAKNAYATIVDEWNAENAAKKFLALSEELIDSQKAVFSTEEGVCSKAELLSDNWFIRRNKKCSKN